MGDWIKENTFTASVITFILLLAIFFIAIVKPVIDAGDKKTYNALEQEFVSKADTIIEQNKVIIQIIGGS